MLLFVFLKGRVLGEGDFAVFVRVDEGEQPFPAGLALVPRLLRTPFAGHDAAFAMLLRLLRQFLGPFENLAAFEKAAT